MVKKRYVQERPAGVDGFLPTAVGEHLAPKNRTRRIAANIAKLSDLFKGTLQMTQRAESNRD
jgi:hypothetical protein